MHDQSHSLPPTAPRTDAGAWQSLEETSLFASPHLEVWNVRTRSPMRPDGHPDWLVVKRKPAVVIVPRTREGKFLLIEQERIPVQTLLLEFPAGQIDSPNAGADDAESAAHRELLEETGHQTSAPLSVLGKFFSSPGFTNETQTIFLANEVEPSAHKFQPRPEEAIAGLREVSPAELRSLVACGGMRDANSLVAFALLSARGIL